MLSPRLSTLFVFTLLCAAPAAVAQPAPAAKPDVLVLNNGETLIGHLEWANGGSVTFKSDMLGVLTIDWSKVKELRASGKYAVVEKGVKLNRHESAARIPQGTVSVADKKITVDPGAGQPQSTVPVGSSEHVIDVKTFDNAILRSPGILGAWKGSITAGATLVEATQHSRVFNGGFNFVRETPTVTWLRARDRTIINFSGSYGILSQPDTPRLKTSIYHAGLERDEYFSPRLYGFGQAAFDHNFSQGLDLQQEYGGGIGWTAIQKPNETLDLKSSVSYLKQQFQVADLNQNLIGSKISQDFRHRFPRSVTFIEELSITPTWNNLDAYAAAASATLTVPVYKRISFSTGGSDTFLDNPPPGFRKNSFQFTMGLTYSLQ